METSCYNCRFHFVEGKKLGCTFPGICHTPDGRELAYEAINELKKLAMQVACRTS